MTGKGSFCRRANGLTETRTESKAKPVKMFFAAKQRAVTERRKNKKMIKKLNVVLFVLGLFVMGVMNLFLYNRADVSAAENRTLAKFPQFST